MKNEKIIHNIIEGLYINNDSELIFDYSKDGIIKVNLGKSNTDIKFKPYTSKSKDFLGYEVVTAYTTQNIKGKDREELITPILKALKGQNDIKVNKADLKLFLKRTALYLARYIKQNYSIDTVLSIKSSSKLNNYFVDELINYLGNVAIIPDAIYKADINKLSIIGNPSDDQRKKLEKIIIKAKSQGKISLHSVHSSLRKYIGNIFDIENIIKHIEGKQVIIIDDIITSRQSMSQAIMVVNQFNPKVIVGVSLFK